MNISILLFSSLLYILSLFMLHITVVLSPGYVLVPDPPTDKDVIDINVSNNNELDNNR